MLTQKKYPNEVLEPIGGKERPPLAQLFVVLDKLH